MKRCPTQHKHSKLRGNRCKLARFPSYKAGRIYILQPSGFRAGAAGAEKAEGWPREVPRPNSGVPGARVPSTSTEGGGPHGSLSLLTPRGAVRIPRFPGQVPRWMSGGRATVLWALVVTEVARSLFGSLKEQVESLKGLYGMSSQRGLERRKRIAPAETVYGEIRCEASPKEADAVINRSVRFTPNAAINIKATIAPEEEEPRDADANGSGFPDSVLALRDGCRDSAPQEGKSTIYTIHDGVHAARAVLVMPTIEVEPGERD